MNQGERVGSDVAESYAEEWERHAGARGDMMAAATELLLDAAGVAAGVRVLGRDPRLAGHTRHTRRAERGRRVPGGLGRPLDGQHARAFGPASSPTTPVR